MKNKNLKNLSIISSVVIIAIIISVISINKKEDKPTKPTFDGFKWVKLKNKEIELWVQENDNIKFKIKDNKVYITKKGEKENQANPVITIFHAENLTKLKEIIKSEKNNTENQMIWDNIENCEFIESKIKKDNVIKYTLTPTGKAKEEMMKEAQKYPISKTCNNYGVGVSGIRYFEIHKNNKNKIIFMEIGQDRPLFDEDSIKIK